MSSTSLTAEMALLGAILIDAAVLSDCRFIKASHFALYAHREVFEAIHLCVGSTGGTLDLVLLMEQLGEANAELEAVGGPTYLQQLIECCPSSQSAPHYARIVFEHAARRHLALLCSQLLHESKADLGSAMDKALKEIGAVRAALRKANEPAPTPARPLTRSKA